MTHPTTAPGGWELEYIVYPGSPGEIAIGVLRRQLDAPLPDQPTRKTTHLMMGLRWCEGDASVASWQAGAHEWFVLPFTFAAAITRSLLQMRATGFKGFDETGFQRLVEWMTDYGQQGVDDCLCY